MDERAEHKEITLYDSIYMQTKHGQNLSVVTEIRAGFDCVGGGTKRLSG